MQTRTITFQGEDFGPNGLPERFHRYLIVIDAAPNLGDNKFLASIIPFTDCPMVTPPYLVGDSADNAFENVLDTLRKLVGNEGLKDFSS